MPYNWTDEETDRYANGIPYHNEDLGVEPMRMSLDCLLYEESHYRAVHGKCVRLGGIEKDGMLVGETTDKNFKFALVVWLDTGYPPTVDYVHERDIA